MEESTQMREVTYPKVTPVEQAIKITADPREPRSGASHFYSILLSPPEQPSWITGIKFQNGPIAEVGINGITNEALLAVVIDRLDGFMSGEFPSRETAVARTKLEEALMWLNKRTLDRQARGVEGTHAK